jgi:hypothetical protein
MIKRASAARKVATSEGSRPGASACSLTLERWVARFRRASSPAAPRRGGEHRHRRHPIAASLQVVLSELGVAHPPVLRLGGKGGSLGRTLFLC